MFKKMLKNDDALGLCCCTPATVIAPCGSCIERLGNGLGGCFEACFTGFARIFGK